MIVRNARPPMTQMLPLFARITALIDSAQIGTVADEVVGPIDGSRAGQGYHSSAPSVTAFPPPIRRL